MSNLIVARVKQDLYSAVLLPEDNNYYGSFFLIPELKKRIQIVGVVEFTLGKAAEFETLKSFFVANPNRLSFKLIAKFFLDPYTRLRWERTSQFYDCFPGSLECDPFKTLNAAFESGHADFYASSSESEIDYLRSVCAKESVMHLIEPIEITLMRQSFRPTLERNIFGVFLPPDQLTDSRVRKRIPKNLGNNYEEVIRAIVERTSNISSGNEELVLFPHPRIYESNPQLIVELSRKYKVSHDFSDYLSRMKYSLIFSSAVFSALLSAQIKVYNLDLFGYRYLGVFPSDNQNFINIAKIEDIPTGEGKSNDFVQSGNHNSGISIIEVLKRYL